MSKETLELLRRLDETVYSNSDHVLKESVVAELEKGDCYANHTGWDYCGNVFKDGNCWVEHVWRYRRVIDTIEGDSAEAVIRETINRYGAD